jgi:hypothetical protein
VLHDPPSPLVVFRRITGAALALATLALLVELIASGDIEWRLVALVFALWSIWGAGTEVYQRFVEPLGRFVWGQLFSPSRITLDDEIADLKHRLTEKDLPPDREISATVRLAEIYRRYRADMPRALELLDRLLLKYPDNPDLRAARGLKIDPQNKNWVSRAES